MPKKTKEELRKWAHEKLDNLQYCHPIVIETNTDIVLGHLLIQLGFADVVDKAAEYLKEAKESHII